MRRNVSEENCVHAKSCPRILNAHVENCTISWSNKVFRGAIIHSYFGVHCILFTYHSLAFSDKNKYEDVGHYNILQKRRNVIRVVLNCSVKNIEYFYHFQLQWPISFYLCSLRE